MCIDLKNIAENISLMNIMYTFLWRKKKGEKRGN